MGRVGDIELSAYRIDGDTARTLKGRVRNETQAVSRTVEDRDAFLLLFDNVQVLLGIKREPDGLCEPFRATDLGKGLLREVECEHRTLGNVRNVQTVAIIRHREAHRLNDAIGRRLDAAQEIQEFLVERRVTAEILVAGDRANELDPRGQRRRRPYKMHGCLGWRRSGTAGQHCKEHRSSRQARVPGRVALLSVLSLCHIDTHLRFAMTSEAALLLDARKRRCARLSQLTTRTCQLG